MPDGRAALATPGRTADEVAVLDTLRPGLSDLLGGLDARAIDARAAVGAPIRQALAELGLFGLAIPEAWGGFGLSLHATGSVLAEVARRDRSVATTVGLHNGLGTRGIVAFGPDGARDRWLPDLAAGRSVAAFATTEPEAGSDLAALRTTATPTATGWSLTGGKIYVTNGGFADRITLTAASPGAGGARRGHSLFLVTPDDPGVTVGPEEHKLGLRGSSTTSLHLDAVPVGADRLVGTPGEGMPHLHHVLAWGRTLMAFGCVGTARAALDAALTHTSTRRQFGRPLAAFDVVREQLAGMVALLYAAESLVRWCAAAEDEPAVLASRSTAAKVFASEAGWEIADLAVQLHGGAGFVEDTGVAILLRDSRITRIFEGANDVLRLHLGLLEVTRRSPRAPLTPLGDLGLRADALHAGVADERARLDAAFGVRLAGQQALLHRLGSRALLRDATDATALRASVDPGGQAAAAHWIALAERRMAALAGPPVDRVAVDRVVAPLLDGVA